MPKFSFFYSWSLLFQFFHCLNSCEYTPNAWPGVIVAHYCYPFELSHSGLCFCFFTFKFRKDYQIWLVAQSKKKNCYSTSLLPVRVFTKEQFNLRYSEFSTLSPRILWQSTGCELCRINDFFFLFCRLAKWVFKCNKRLIHCILPNK